MDELKTEVKELLFKISGLQSLGTSEISDTMSLFNEGLGLDSIDVLELVVHLEKKYGLHIRNNEEGKIVLQNINSIVEAILKKRASEEA